MLKFIKTHKETLVKKINFFPFLNFEWLAKYNKSIPFSKKHRRKFAINWHVIQATRAGPVGQHTPFLQPGTNKLSSGNYGPQIAVKYAPLAFMRKPQRKKIYFNVNLSGKRWPFSNFIAAAFTLYSSALCLLVGFGWVKLGLMIYCQANGIPSGPSHAFSFFYNLPFLPWQK